MRAQHSTMVYGIVSAICVAKNWTNNKKLIPIEGAFVANLLCSSAFEHIQQCMSTAHSMSCDEWAIQVSYIKISAPNLAPTNTFDMFHRLCDNAKCVCVPLSAMKAIKYNNIYFGADKRRIKCMKCMVTAGQQFEEVEHRRPTTRHNMRVCRTCFQCAELYVVCGLAVMWCRPLQANL